MKLELAEYDEDTHKFSKNVNIIEIGDKHIFPWYIPVVSIIVKENNIKFNLSGKYKIRETVDAIWVMTDDEHMKKMLKEHGLEKQYIPEKMR